MEQRITQLNIQPQAGVLGVFSRLNYKPWHAIAEFVDNSTQSFYSNQRRLKERGFNSVTVDIVYDFESNVLTIKDDAYGMELEEFHRAVKVDSVPEVQGGRNEFGMGLKTAASWFGNLWCVESTQLGSINKYYTEVNIDELRSKNLNNIDIIAVDCDELEHGTTITIKNITKKIDGSRTKGKIIKLLESMYRRDINSGRVTINFNGERLYFEGYECLTFRDKTWRKDVDFNFEFDGKQHHVKGFVGILKNGGFGKAGFALFRRNRVVIGGEEQNYKPLEIFSQIQSQISLKLFGELDLDDFDINQAKDGFVWDNGLELEFIQNLKSNIQEYINIAKISNKERANEESLSLNASSSIHEEVSKTVENINFADSTDMDQNNDSEFTTVDDDLEQYKNFVDIVNNGPEIVLDDKVRPYNINIDAVTKKVINVKWSIVNKQYWIDVQEESNDVINILINVNHPFFKPYSEDINFKKVLEKFVIAFVVAEQQAKLTSENDGYIMANAIRTKMNQFLAKMIGD